MENSVVSSAKSTPLGKRIWFCAVFFGLIGQIAWVVENMFFAKFGQDLFDTQGELYYTVTTLMVILSALTATVTTIFAGGLVDKTGKRKPFITFGYIIWGVTIMLFAAVPINFSASENWGIIAVLVILDCVMTFFGSTSNDAAFNAWVTDVTDSTNRGKVNTILSVMPVVATVLVFGIGMFTYDNGATVTNEAGEIVKVAIGERNPLFIKLFRFPHAVHGKPRQKRIYLPVPQKQIQCLHISFPKLSQNKPFRLKPHRAHSASFRPCVILHAQREKGGPAAVHAAASLPGGAVRRRHCRNVFYAASLP